MLDKLPWEEHCRGTLLLPPLLQTLLPFPDQLPLTALYRHAVEQVCDRRRNKWHRTGWLLARAGYVSPCCKVMCYGICAFVLRCFFLFSHCTPKWSIVWGLIFFFSSLSSCNAVFFFHSLSSCSVYPVVICMLCMYGQVDG